MGQTLSQYIGDDVSSLIPRVQQLRVSVLLVIKLFTAAVMGGCCSGGFDGRFWCTRWLNTLPRLVVLCLLVMYLINVLNVDS